jgi:hypothetical protein
MADRPYVRVYYEIVDDEKFANVYGDDRALAGWLRLLLTADASYPASAPIPRWIAPKTLKTLEFAGLVTIKGHQYTIKGLASERTMRSDSARNAAAQRWQSERNAGASGPAMLAKPSLAEPSKAEPSPANGAHDADLADTWWTLTGKYPAGRLLSWLDAIGNEFGHDQASRVMAAEHQRDSASNTLASRTQDRLKSEKRNREKAGEARERERVVEFAKRRAITPEQAAENRERLKAMLPEHMKGGHS